MTLIANQIIWSTQHHFFCMFYVSIWQSRGTKPLGVVRSKARGLSSMSIAAPRRFAYRPIWYTTTSACQLRINSVVKITQNIFHLEMNRNCKVSTKHIIIQKAKPFLCHCSQVTARKARVISPFPLKTSQKSRSWMLTVFGFNYIYIVLYVALGVLTISWL